MKQPPQPDPAIFDPRTPKPRPKLYLAGPDIFYSNAAQLMRDKCDMTRNYGFEPLNPLDNEATFTLEAKHGMPRDTRAAITRRQIYRADEDMIERCDGIIANVSPFQGLHADPGTCVEIGLARALGKRIFAYTMIEGTLIHRAFDLSWISPRRAAKSSSETAASSLSHEPGTALEIEQIWVDRYGCEIEDLDACENLMVTEAVHLTGGYPVVQAARFEGYLGGFKECLRLARYVMLADWREPCVSG